MRLVLLAATVVALAQAANATTWALSSVKCPLCGTTDTYGVVASAGGYVYFWPSKDEYVFWPYIEELSLYCCRQCGLTEFMDDFEKLPDGKQAAVRQALAGVSISPRYESYNDVPMPLRLGLAERVYRVLDRDKFFWSRFYRVAGYHYAKAGLAEPARSARRNALRLAQELLAAGASRGRAKELLVISGAMRRALGDDAGALGDFAQALGLIQSAPGMTPDECRDETRYLNRLLGEWLAKLAWKHRRTSAVVVLALLAPGVALYRIVRRFSKRRIPQTP